MKSKCIHYTGLIILGLFWISLSETLDFQVLTIGLIIYGLVYIYDKEKTLYFTGKRFANIVRIKYMIKYLLLLLKEIVIANFQVARIVLSKDLKISPKTVIFKTSLKNDLTKTILANSITLTPGTITVKVFEDKFIVHCLLEDYKKNIVDSGFEKILLKIEE